MRWHCQKGITIIELLIAAGIVAIMALFVGNFLIDSFDNNRMVQGLADLGNYSQQAVNRIRLDISQSKRLMDNSIDGIGYWDLVRFPQNIRPVAGSRLPEIIDHGSLSPSKVDDFRNPFIRESAGNILFYAEHMPAIESVKDKRVIDIYRFVVYFLLEHKGNGFNPNVNSYLDLQRCESGPYADLYQVRDVQNDKVRRHILNILEESNVTALWDPQVSSAVAFTRMDGYDPKNSQPLVRHAIQMKRCFSAISGLGRLARSTGTILYSVSFNKGKHFQINRPVPLYAKAEETFPHGFEVLIVGPRSARQVLLRIVLAAPLRKQILTREATVIATVRDS